MSKSRVVSLRPIRSAFSLVELLVVIAIIAIIVAILVPTLGGVRKQGKVAATATLLSQLNDASAQFQNDERRVPGYYSAAQMGNPDNAKRGFSGMNNVLLDLAGGILRSGSGPTGIGSGQARVGPTRLVNEQVVVDPNLIGTTNGGSKGYFTPSAKYFVKQTDQQKFCSTAKDHYLLPDLVDAFGDPILAWSENEAATQPVTTLDDFAQVDSGTASKPPARFYWNANAAFFGDSSMGSTPITLGKQGKTQDGASLLAYSKASTSGPSGGTTDRAKALACMLGNPGYPNLAAGTSLTSILPAASRGKLAFQSAGGDGIFLSAYDSGGKFIQSAQMDYQFYFHAPGSTNPYTDDTGKNKPNDFLGKFDDIFFFGGS